MGMQFSWASPVSNATWTNFIIASSLSPSGPFSTIATIAAKDSNGRWVTSYWDENGTLATYYTVQPTDSVSHVSGTASTPITAISITTNYTTPQKVASLLQCGQFGGDTRPTITEVQDLCSRVEDEIDRKTSHAWRTRYSATTTGKATSANYEMHNIDQPYIYDAGIPIYLNHRKILQMDATQGDEVGVWNGSIYENYVVIKTEGRNNDYWFDYDMGVLYLRVLFPYIRHRTIQLKYRYGENFVPDDVVKLATYLVAIDLALSNDRSYLIPAGGDSVKLDGKVAEWQKRADKLKEDLVEFGNVGL